MKGRGGAEMAVRHRPAGRAYSMPGGLTIGLIISLSLTLAITGILAKLVNAEKLPWEKIGYGIMLQLFLSTVLGAIAASRAVKRRSFLVCVVSGGLYWISLVGITAMFFGGQYHGFGVTTAVVLGSATAMGFWEARRKDRKSDAISHTGRKKKSAGMRR